MRENTRRRTRGERQPGVAIKAPAHVTRKIPYYEFLNEEGLTWLEEQADWS